MFVVIVVVNIPLQKERRYQNPFANLTEPEPNAAPAALAFDTLREAVALMRRAVVELAAERTAIEIPDYSETLAKIHHPRCSTPIDSRAPRIIAAADDLHAGHGAANQIL